METLSKFIKSNVYMRSIAPTIQTPKHLQTKKFSIQKLSKVLKPKPLLHNKKSNLKYSCNPFAISVYILSVSPTIRVPKHLHLKKINIKLLKI